MDGRMDGWMDGWNTKKCCHIGNQTLQHPLNPLLFHSIFPTMEVTKNIPMLFC